MMGLSGNQQSILIRKSLWKIDHGTSKIKILIQPGILVRLRRTLAKVSGLNLGRCAVAEIWAQIWVAVRWPKFCAVAIKESFLAPRYVELTN